MDPPFRQQDYEISLNLTSVYSNGVQYVRDVTTVKFECRVVGRMNRRQNLVILAFIPLRRIAGDFMILPRNLFF